MYIWSEGDTYCENLISGHKAHLYLKPKSFSFWKTDDYKAEGEVLGPKGEKLYEL